MSARGALPSPETKADYVERMFNRIAPGYDRLNDCITLGMHRGWKRAACEALRLQPGDAALDVCTGTGDLTKQLSDYVGADGEVVGLDFSEAMLAIARQRFAHKPQVRFVQGDALKLPFENERFNGAVISFGLRNVVDYQQALCEMARVVKPGGRVVNLDTHPSPALPGVAFYFSNIMPRIGRLLSSDDSAYQYLSESTARFPTPEALQTLFETAGLCDIQIRSLGFHAVSLQVGRKP